MQYKHSFKHKSASHLQQLTLKLVNIMLSVSQSEAILYLSLDLVQTLQY